MKREHLQQTYQRDEAASKAAVEAIKRRLAEGTDGPDPFANDQDWPDLPEAEDDVVAEIRPKPL